MKLTTISPMLTILATIATSTASFSQAHVTSSETAVADLVNHENNVTTTIAESANSFNELYATSTAPEISFFCEESNEIPTTVVRFYNSDEQQDLAFLQWLANYFPATNQAQQLCESVSAKLQDYYENNDVDFEYFSLVVRNINNQSVACIEESMESGCANNGILFSFNDVSNPNDALSDMLGEQLKETMNPTRGDFRLPLYNLFPW